ncbi:unnamed protein product [Periconia digitata]|uniref:Zn(2)-C6 fungal-type domain-containing protein n=1 Tax=Periconia digitata TaxID=1303443 RepID=A0A9W4UBG1_9PLEO|nr:unnamed protein product [Periconia digitata]
METTLPRRTLRKGTHSCLECKRRKIRCFFDQNSTTSCVSCLNRGTPCFSQDSLEASVPRDWENSERLKRMEQMLQDLTEKFLVQDFNLDALETGDVSRDLTASVEGAESRIDERSRPIYSSNSSRQEKYAESCQLIHAAFPSQEVVDRIFGDARASIYLQALCNPYQQLFTDKNKQSSNDLARIPPQTAHPILLARKLLQLALCMQQLDPSFDRNQLHGITDVRSSMNAFYELASRITCHDELLNSMEGLECLMCEAVFLINGGNLRQALATLRRATTVSQMMQLHRKPHTIPLAQLDPNTCVSGEFTWVHFGYLERYISLLIGMPSSIASTRFDTGKKRDAERDEEWFERSQIDLCNQIISRNQNRDYDISNTMDIDKNLNAVVAQTATAWWSPLDFTPGMAHQEMMSRMISAQMQIIHFNMLTVLHLPHLLCKETTDQRFEYSRYTCFYASREVLIRFLAFRSHIKVVYCCRPVDFCAFTAAMTLLLAYLNGNSATAGFDFAQQRAQDLDLISRSLSTLDELTRLNGDELSENTAKLTRKMLQLEDSMGKLGNDVVCNVVDGDNERDGNEANTQDFLYLSIPYFGCIKLSTAPAPNLSATPLHSGTTTKLHDQQLLSIESVRFPSDVSGDHPLATHTIFHTATHTQDLQATSQNWDWPMLDRLAGSEEWAFQGVDTTLFDSVMSGCDENFVNNFEWHAGWGPV